MTTRNRSNQAEANRLLPEDRAVHDWYRFILSYPPHLVRGYLDRWALTSEHCVLDPFCGTGTTLVECKKLGVPSVGVEAVGMSHFASSVKIDWTPDPQALLDHATAIARQTLGCYEREGIEDQPALFMGPNGHHKLRELSPEAVDLLLADSISPLPLHKTLVLLDVMERLGDEAFLRHERLVLARALASSIGNLHFGPEVGVGPPRPDAAVVSAWMSGLKAMGRDLSAYSDRSAVPSCVHLADSRRILQVLDPASVDAVITSPPYPNEKDYTRTTRLESVILGFIESKAQLRAMKQTLVRSNTRSVYKTDQDDLLVADHPRIQEIAAEIERRRIEMGKTSGFERMYARLTKLYFGGIKRHLADLRTILRPGAHLAYVVGDQASYLRVMIRTGEILGDLANSLGYELVGIDLFRTRIATATKDQLREEVVVLRWPG